MTYRFNIVKSKYGLIALLACNVASLFSAKDGIGILDFAFFYQYVVVPYQIAHAIEDTVQCDHASRMSSEVIEQQRAKRSDDFAKADAQARKLLAQYHQGSKEINVEKFRRRTIYNTKLLELHRATLVKAQQESEARNQAQ